MGFELHAKNRKTKHLDSMLLPLDSPKLDLEAPLVMSVRILPRYRMEGDLERPVELVQILDLAHFLHVNTGVLGDLFDMASLQSA